MLSTTYLHDPVLEEKAMPPHNNIKLIPKFIPSINSIKRTLNRKARCVEILLDHDPDFFTNSILKDLSS
ncbi:unnamed protein product [Moneuplotes crassus]|uniref:Uncharacterized protein n=1 Tax=Euplotes crassus TaxID=5936 RepID=A0AAD1XLH5_EUPCR|nr:unnamed protein product [Moneuplotes crassus]